MFGLQIFHAIGASAWITYLQEIVELLVGGITTLATGLGNGIQSLVTNLMTVTTGEGASAVTSLSAFGAFIAIFGGISLCIGISRLILHWATSFGARN